MAGDDSILGDSGNDTLTGSAGADSLDGAEGATTSSTGHGKAIPLDGGLGPDSMAGGSGDDFYMVGEAGDVVDADPAEGGSTPFEQASPSFLRPHWKNLELDGSLLDGNRQRARTIKITSLGKLQRPYRRYVGDDTLKRRRFPIR